MRLVHWTRFTWDLAALPGPPRVLEPHYNIRPATREEERTIRSVISSAFALDMNWSDTLKSIKDWLDARLDEAFAEKVTPCLVVTHGSRIIGASALDLAHECECNLVTGPCILSEYRNRGIGSQLLHASLAGLRDSGLSHARGITKANLPVAKFVYSKFQSTAEPYQFEPDLVRT